VYSPFAPQTSPPPFHLKDVQSPKMSSNAHPNPKRKIFQKANNQMMSKSSEEKKG